MDTKEYNTLQDIKKILDENELGEDIRIKLGNLVLSRIDELEDEMNGMYEEHKRKRIKDSQPDHLLLDMIVYTGVEDSEDEIVEDKLPF